MQIITDQYLYYQTPIEVLKKLMCNRMKDFIDKQDILYSPQYDFRKARFSSSHSAIIDIVETFRVEFLSI